MANNEIKYEDKKNLEETNETTKQAVKILGYTVEYDKKKFEDLLKLIKPNEKWKTDLEEYHKKQNKDLDYHLKNCSKISSLRNRVFAQHEIEALKSNWDGLQFGLELNSENGNGYKDQYKKVIDIFTEDKSFNELEYT